MPCWLSEREGRLPRSPELERRPQCIAGRQPEQGSPEAMPHGSRLHQLQSKPPPSRSSRLPRRDDPAGRGPLHRERSQPPRACRDTAQGQRGSGSGRPNEICCCPQQSMTEAPRWEAGHDHVERGAGIPRWSPGRPSSLPMRLRNPRGGKTGVQLRRRSCMRQALRAVTLERSCARACAPTPRPLR